MLKQLLRRYQSRMVRWSSKPKPHGMAPLGPISPVEPFGAKTGSHSKVAHECACEPNFLEVVAMVQVMAYGRPTGSCLMMEVAGLLEKKSTSWRWSRVTGMCMALTTGHAPQ